MKNKAKARRRKPPSLWCRTPSKSLRWSPRCPSPLRCACFPQEPDACSWSPWGSHAHAHDMTFSYWQWSHWWWHRWSRCPIEWTWGTWHEWNTLRIAIGSGRKRCRTTCSPEAGSQVWYSATVLRPAVTWYDSEVNRLAGSQLSNAPCILQSNTFSVTARWGCTSLPFPEQLVRLCISIAVPMVEDHLYCPWLGALHSYCQTSR